MSAFEAWHLPGIAADKLATEQRSFDKLSARVAAPTAAQLKDVVAHIKAARESALLNRPVRDIVTAIDAAAVLLADPHAEEGAQARALLPLATGYSSETIEDVLRHMTSDWRADSLEKLLIAELGKPEVLDRPTRTATATTMARGPRFAFHVFSGNVPGVAVTSIVRSLLVKAATLGKTASGEPVLPVLFARALAKTAPDLAQCLAVTYWPGGSTELEGVALASADAVVVYGGEETVRSLAERSSNARLLVHGPRISFGIVGKRADAAVAASIARAVAAYDQQGCVSPHVVFVEKGGVTDGRTLAAAISAELEILERLQPRRRLSASEATAFRSARSSAEFRSIGGAAVEVFGVEGMQHSVIYDEATSFPVSCLNRLLYVVPVSCAEDVANLTQPHRELLQSVALGGFEEGRLASLSALLGDCGVSRITSFDALPWPPMWWHHDGRGPLRELLTWTDLEL